MKLISCQDVSLTALTALWNTAFADYLVPVTLTEAGLAQRFSRLNLSVKHSLVAQVQGQNAGIMLLGQQVFQGETVGWIGGMAVSPAYRRQGIAGELLRAGLTQLQALKATRVYLEVIDGNHGAEGLYRRLGFEECNRVSVGQGSLAVALGSSQGVVLKETVLSAAHLEEEPALTTWQNRLGRDGMLQDIYCDEQRSGYVYYTLSQNDQHEKILRLKQLVMTHGPSQTVADVLAGLAEQVGPLACHYSNFDVDSPVTKTLQALGFKEQLQQIQLAYTF